jgi:hypothetical protein
MVSQSAKKPSVKSSSFDSSESEKSQSDKVGEKKSTNNLKKVAFFLIFEGFLNIFKLNKYINRIYQKIIKY